MGVVERPFLVAHGHYVIVYIWVIWLRISRPIQGGIGCLSVLCDKSAAKQAPGRCAVIRSRQGYGSEDLSHHGGRERMP